MKAIVANILFGSIFGCLGCPSTVLAKPIAAENRPQKPTPAIISSKLLSYDKLPVVPQIINFVDRILTVKKGNNIGFAVAKNLKISLSDDQRSKIISDFSSKLDLQNNQDISQDSPYTYKDKQANLALGFQNTFWSGSNNRKYWGLTTVEQWGGNQNQKLNIAKLNYLDAAPKLPSGTSTLTVSGGGNQNLAKAADTSGEFEKFRGGITYHHGIANQVTVGVGFVYEDLLVGFTQLTYQSELLPIKTTVSLLAKESGIDLHSHVRLQPGKNLVLNYYSDQEKHKFDANWGVIPGLILMAKSNSKDKSFSTGIKVAVHNNFLSLSANAVIDNNNNLYWNLSSQIGRLQFAYGNNQQKSTAELNLRLLDSVYGFQCSSFFKYEAHLVNQDQDQEQEQFTVWGGRLHSGKTVGKNKHQWTLDLGYGQGSHGQGIIASSSVALKPNLFLDLSYQEISPTSDDTKVKVLLSSK